MFWLTTVKICPFVKSKKAKLSHLKLRVRPRLPQRVDQSLTCNSDHNLILINQLIRQQADKTQYQCVTTVTNESRSKIHSTVGLQTDRQEKSGEIKKERRDCFPKATTSVCSRYSDVTPTDL
jgi:hypothetical protein